MTKAWLCSVYHPLRIRTSFRSAAPSIIITGRPGGCWASAPEADPDTWFYTVHMGWWDDAEDPFAGQWEQLNQFLQEKGRLDSGKNVWLLGDFNSPSAVSGEGYDCIRKAGWLDSYVLAAQKDDGATVDHVIDGWRDKMAEGENCRLDYMFSRNPVRIRSSRVICNGTLYPVVSDHFGVMVTV